MAEPAFAWDANQSLARAFSRDELAAGLVAGLRIGRLRKAGMLSAKPAAGADVAVSVADVPLRAGRRPELLLLVWGLPDASSPDAALRLLLRDAVEALSVSWLAADWPSLASRAPAVR